MMSRDSYLTFYLSDGSVCTSYRQTLASHQYPYDPTNEDSITLAKLRAIREVLKEAK